MQGKSCGNCSCSHDHHHKADHGHKASGVGGRLVGAILILVVAGVGAISALVLAGDRVNAGTHEHSQQAPAQASAPKAPAQPVSTPAAQPASTPAPSATPGVIRHGRKDPIAKPAGVVRIATYNIENLFDAEQPSDEPGRAPTPPKPEAHRKCIADAIRKIDADIIALQEISSKDALTKFRDEYLKDLGYVHISSIDAGDGRGIEQSVISRFPLKDEVNWPKISTGQVHPEKLGKKPHPDAGKPLNMARSPLRVTASVPGADGKPVDFTFFVVHHKSGPFHSYQREAEAAKVTELAKQYIAENVNANVLILGDFNAKPEEKAVQTYLTSGFTDAFGDVLAPRADPQWISHVSGRVIDHILLSPAAAARLNKDTRFVLGTIQRPENVNWRTTAPPDGYCSDHYPVVIDLSLSSSPAPAKGEQTPASKRN